jgi:hypothetical protein
MAKRVAFILAGLSWLLGIGLVFGQQAKAPEWTHGLELAARKADEKEFTDKTRRFGGEAFLDPNRNALFYITETGALAALPAAGFTVPKEIKAPKWLGAMNLAVRKAGEKDFADSTKKYGVEVFRDETSGVLIYISETGSIAVVRGGAAGSAAKPVHLYGYELRVRKGPEGDFTKDTQKFGVEVFKDDATGTLLYLSETGAIAALPAGPNPVSTETKKPDWMHGLGLPVRKAGEKDFTPSTQKFGVEVFKDDRAGNLIYIAEKGDLAVVPAGNFTRPEEKTKAPTRLPAQEVRVRKSGEKEFTATTRKWGIEVYRDENAGNIIYNSEAGSLAVLPPK